MMASVNTLVQIMYDASELCLYFFLQSSASAVVALESTIKVKLDMALTVVGVTASLMKMIPIWVVLNAAVGLCV